MSEPEAQKEIASLQETIQKLEQTSKMLVRRDLSLRKAYDNLKTLDVEKTEFVSIAAHQLRTPVTSARWAVTYLLEDQSNLTEKQQKLLNQADVSIGRIYRLVENLLELNRIDFRSIQLDLKSGNVEKLCEEIIKEHECIKERQHITINRNFALDSKPVSFDSVRLKQVVDNLIDNAIKYSGDGTAICITTKYTPETVTISVSDNGIGITPGSEHRIFHKFSRLENAEKIDPNGTGLGLYISRKIIEAHGGQVAFTKNKPTGTIFTITLPC